MKIAFVITGLGMGGAEHVVVNLADKLSKQGVEVLLVYLTGQAFVFPKNKKIKVIAINMIGYRDFFNAYIKLRKIIKEFKPDVVHGHMVHANILTRLLRLSLHIPRLISTAHNTNEGGRLRMLAYRFTDMLCDITTNVSEDAVNAFISKKAVNSKKIICVHNGISTDRFNYSFSERNIVRKELNISSNKLLLAVGRLEIAKDYPNLINAIALLKDERLDFKLIIVGEGSQKQKLIELVSTLGVQDYVEFIGVRRDIPSLMSASDIFVLPSAWEGFGLVVAEAMACQRVIVATDCGGVKEVLGSTGFLVQPRQAPELAEALSKALSLSPQDSDILGKAARQRVQSYYSLDAAVEKWLKLYSCPIKSIGSLG